MWRLHRYYLKELAVNASITFLVLFAVALVSFIYRGIQRAAGGTLVDALLITVLFALDSLQHLLTIAFLLATVMTYTRAAQDRELTAIRAAGIAPRVPMMPALLLGILLSAGASLAMHYVIPWVHFNKYRVVADVMRNAFLNLRLGTDRIKLLDTGFVMTFREQVGSEYRDCRVYCPKALDGLDSPLLSPILRVERVSCPAPEEGATSLAIVLSGLSDPIGGWRNPADLVIAMPISDLGNRNRREDGDADLRSDQLLAEVLREVHPRPQDALFTLFRRCCASLMPVVLAPIGYCLGELARERGRVFALLLSLIPLVLFYSGDVLGARLLLSTKNPWCGWLPLVLLGGFGLPLLWRQLRR